MNFEVCGFEHLHRHSCFSLLDGVAKVSEYAERSKEINQRYLCITDHGMMAAIPQQIAESDKHNLSPIFGCEVYFNPNQPELKSGEGMKYYLDQMSPEEKAKMRKSHHLVLLAENETGYKNLVRLSSWAWLHGFYYKPRINWEQLLKHKEGIVIGSACYNSPFGQALEKKGEDAAFDEVKKFHDVFGDKFYLELMMLDFDKQKPYDRFLIKAHEKYNIPLTLTQDCHYCKKEDALLQRLMLMVGTKRTVDEMKLAVSENRASEYFELQDENLWMKSEDELNEKWESDYYDVIPYEIFKEAKRNSVRICEQCEGVELDRSMKLPRWPDENEMLKKAIIEGVKKRNIPKTKEYLSRVKEEFDLICDKEFSSYFIIQQMMTNEARRACAEILGYESTGSEAVGPGRGSGAGSLINYCLQITDVDPIKHDLLFSRFMNPARGGKQMQVRFGGKPISVKSKESPLTIL